MLEILIRAGCYVAIIALGYLLRKKEFLPEAAFGVLSKIVINITLPAAIIASTSGKGIDAAMLTVTLLALCCGVANILLAWLLHAGRSREEKAFMVLNTPGYNIGNFAMPFTQSFLGPLGVVTTSLFDIGNAFICLGGAYGVASVIKDGKGFSLKRILLAPVRSIPFVTYVLMAILNLIGLSMPDPVVELAQIAGAANPFLGMLMIGVGFRLSGDRSQVGTIARVLGMRYGLAVVLALCIYFVLPFPLEVRQTMVLLVFSPFGSAIPAFTEKLGGDVGLSSAINSIGIICSIVIMVTLLVVML